MIYEKEAVRGSWLNRWFGIASPADALRAPAEVRRFVGDAVLSILQASRSSSNDSPKPSRSPRHLHKAPDRSSSSKTAPGSDRGTPAGLKAEG
ncbi:hypothetical protein [Streptomyces sp. IBSBF 3136]|uniref:hypothetical protein n=1 Tax=Streptomyces sp. IBSBF 3136 TaxID=2903524 RepID=UPI002FDBBB73